MRSGVRKLENYLNFLSLRFHLLLSIAATFLVLLLIEFSPLKLVEKIYEDLLIIETSKKRAPSSDIVILKITEATLARFSYRSPIDREFIAQLVSKLNNANPKAIGLDILFDQKTESEKDKRLQEALRAAAKRVTVASGTVDDGLTPAQAEFQNHYLKDTKVASVVLAKDEDDGVVRHEKSGQIVDGTLQQSLANSMYGGGVDGLAGNFERIFFQSDSNGTPHKFKSYPAEAAILLPDKWIEGKYVLIGMDLPGIDQFRTPFVSLNSGKVGILPGVEIHAHILNQLISQTRIHQTEQSIKIVLMLIAGLFGAWLIVLRVPVWTRMLLVILGGVLTLLVPWFLFPANMLILPAVAATTTMILVSALGSALLWQRDRSQKHFIRNAWERYVSPTIVEDLISNPDKLEAGGERVDATFIFTDVAGFTTLAESTSPETLSTVMNQYLDLVNYEFLRSGATIDKIVGDAVVGFFGAPIADPSHPNEAVSFAVKLNDVCQKFQNEMREQGVEFGKTRIGIHSGTAIIGNFGGSGFFDYTAIGDSVNTAARLEAANKIIGGNVCVSGDTARRAIDHRFRTVGRLRLPGKSNLVDVLEPVMTNESKLADLALYEKAYAGLEGNKRNTRKLFEGLKEKFPQDHLVAFHLKRLRSGHRGTVIELDK